MERTHVDAWTRVDPVFNEGTPVEGRVALRLQVISDRVARVCHSFVPYSPGRVDGCPSARHASALLSPQRRLSVSTDRLAYRQIAWASACACTISGLSAMLLPHDIDARHRVHQRVSGDSTNLTAGKAVATLRCLKMIACCSPCRPNATGAS